MSGNGLKPLDKAQAKVLPSGLEVVVISKPGFVRKYAVLATRYGSQVTSFRFSDDREEYELPAGTAHFLEHKLFEQEKGNMEERFSELGATSNAFTSNDITGYLFCTDDNFFECLALLFELVHKPVFSDLGVEREKDIIKQEIAMTRDDPDWMGYRTLLTLLYKNHPVAIDPAGTTDSVDEITPEVLYAAHDAFYGSDNMTLLVVGDVKPDDVFGVSSVLDGKFGGKRLKKAEVLEVQEPASVAYADGSLRMDVARPIVWMGMKDSPTLFRADAQARRTVASLLMETAFGPSSRLNDELYSSGIIDENLAFDEHYAKDFGYLSLTAATDRPEELVMAIKAEMTRITLDGLDEEAFLRAKRKLTGVLLKSFDSEEFIAYEYLVDRFHGMDLMVRTAAISSASRKDAEDVAKAAFAETSVSVLTITPAVPGQQRGKDS